MRTHITVDASGCISSGRCVANHPAIFDFDEERRAQVLEPHASLSQEEADEIMDGCPAGVIEITFTP